MHTATFDRARFIRRPESARLGGGGDIDCLIAALCTLKGMLLCCVA